MTPSLQPSPVPPIHQSTNPPVRQFSAPPDIPQLDVAHAAFALLEKLDSGRRRPPPSISKVFRLYCIELLSAAQVARQCHCSKAAVIRRLKIIRHQTGLPIDKLRNHYPQPGFIDGLPAGASSFRMNDQNYLYAGTPPDAFSE